MGDEVELRDALTNLVFNAVDAMPEGGVLTVRTRARTDDSGRRSVNLEVNDTGIGMDEETRRRCIEPFFTTKGQRGTGLGLASVYGMLQRHDATFEVESAPGKGTTMRMIFPAFDDLAETSGNIPGVACTAAPPAHPGHRRRSRYSSVQCATSWKRTVTSSKTALGGQAGIETFVGRVRHGSGKFALVITDLGMPRVDGRKVAAAIKETSRRPRP